MYLPEPNRRFEITYYSGQQSVQHHVYVFNTNTGEVITAAKNINGNGRLVVLRREHKTHPMVAALRDQLQLRQDMVVSDITITFSESLENGRRNAPW